MQKPVILFILFRIYREIPETVSGWVVIAFVCWPMMCGAQMVGPTPQPPGIPITPEEAEQVQPENWAIHA